MRKAALTRAKRQLEHQARRNKPQEVEENTRTLSSTRIPFALMGLARQMG